MPVYPVRALQQRVRGEVVLLVRVSETGEPLEARVTKHLRQDVDEAAVAAAMQWRFEPARQKGRPVRSEAVVRFSFEGVQFARTPFPSESESRRGAPAATPTPTPTGTPTEPWRLRTPAATPTLTPTRTPTEPWRQR